MKNGRIIYLDKKVNSVWDMVDEVSGCKNTN